MEMESRIHETWYHVLCYFSITNKVFKCNKMRERSNGRVTARKQRGRVRWWRRKCGKAVGERGREVISTAGIDLSLRPKGALPAYFIPSWLSG